MLGRQAFWYDNMLKEFSKIKCSYCKGAYKYGEKRMEKEK
jgi:hypothetical protein